MRLLEARETNVAKVELDYDTSIKQEYTDNALSSLTPELIPDERNPRYIRLVGDCPRCEDPMSSLHPTVVALGSTPISDEQVDTIFDELDRMGFDRSTGDVSLDLSCDCKIVHPNAPEGVAGCGAPFRKRVIWP